MSGGAQFILASASPRRRQILESLGLQFRQHVCPVDETRPANETAAQSVQRLAIAKAEAGYHECGAHLPSLGADTLVAVEQHVLGKPAGRDEALYMLRMLSGRMHQVYSAVALASSTGTEVAVHCSQVVFRDITADEASRYWDSGEPHDKAGAYGIQGIGGIFISNLQGSYTGVMGLPVAETSALLVAAGVDLWRDHASLPASEG